MPLPLHDRHRPHGQSMVEFALIVPLLLMLIFGVIELGLLFSVYVGLTNSAREGARAGSVYQYTGTPFLSTDTTAQSKVDEERKTSITKAISETLNPLIEPASVQVTVMYTPTTVAPAYHAYRSGDMLDVTLIHDHPLFFGLFGTQKLTLKANSAMRIEPGDAR